MSEPADIVEFLTARLDEDQADALAARDKHQGVYATTGDAEWRNSASGDGIYTEPHGINVVIGGYGFLDDQTANHIARHDPARVLREIAAKRAIVELCAKFPAGKDWGQWHRDNGIAPTPREQANYGYMLRQLAAAYSDHPDYDSAWKPPPTVAEQAAAMDLAEADESWRP